MMKRRSRQSREGSILLITLLVVSLLMFVVLALVAFVRSELRGMGEHQNQMLARANARLGANLALAELQRTLGPDMRVSATAEILSRTNPDNPDAGVNPFDASETMRFWTGAWSSEDWDPGDSGDRQGRFLRWLVSLPASVAEQIQTVESYDLSDDNQFVTLANLLVEASSGSGWVNRPVRAARQSIESRNAITGTPEETGSYAWWVSDEGVKANLALADPYAGVADPADVEDGNFDADIARFLYPHRPNLALSEWFGDLEDDGSYWQELNAGLEKASGLPGSAWLALQAGEADILDNSDVKNALREDNLFSDYSFFSHGVMSSTRRGGLRGDLSLAFWEDAGLRYPVDRNRMDTNRPFEDHFRFRRIFSPVDYDSMTQNAPGGSNVGSLNPAGARWELLRDFHNSFQKITVESDGYEVIRAAESSLTSNTFHEVPSRQNRGAEGTFRLTATEQQRYLGLMARDLDLNNNGVGDIDNREFIKSPATPVLTRFVLEFTARLVENPDQSAADRVANGTNYRPEIRCYMFANLWNPYNVAISLARNTPGPGGTTRGEIVSLGRPAMMIGMFATQLKMFEIEIEGETWDLGDGTNNQITGDYVSLFPYFSFADGKKGEMAYTTFGRWPWEINDVRETNLSSGIGDDLVAADPYRNSDWEAGEVRLYSIHTELTDNVRVMSNTETVGQPGVLSHFFANVDDPGWHAWRENFKKKLGFWDDGNDGNGIEDDMGFASGTSVTFHFRPKNTANTVQRFDTAFHGYSSNSGNIQLPFQMLATNMDLSEQPVARILQAGLDTDEVPLGVLEFVMKSGVNEKANGDPLNLPVPRFTNFNPRAVIGNDRNTPYGAGQNPLYWFGTMREADRINYLNSTLESGPRSSKEYHKGYFGTDHGPSGQTYLALFDIPRRPVESMGQYQHAMLSAFTHQPAYPFGNSLPDIHVPRSGVIARYREEPDNAWATYLDTSWFLNDALWDDYFLSTIDPYVDSSTTRLRPQRGRFVELDQSVVYNRGDSANPADEVDYSESAGNLLLKGAFNVNSTSVEAWKTVIATLNNEGIRYLDPTRVASDTTNPLSNPFYRHSVPLSQEDQPWTGAPRTLTDSEVTRLAEYMVEQVKARGPFLSISDFVNRRIGSDSDYRTMMGSIQAALLLMEQNTTFENDLVDDIGEVFFAPGEDAPRYWDQNLPPFAKEKPLAFAPGDLTQADVLTSIGPVLASRSDTFVIRSYGEAGVAAPANENTRAWVEMLVQRVPEALEADPLDPYTTGPFGRKFKILNMRYLDSSDL